MEFKRIYVAGSYNANNIITALDNIKKGTQAEIEKAKELNIPVLYEGEDYL